MPDMENVISLVEDAIEIVEKEAFWTIANGLRDAITLLKEQEAVEPETENAVYDIGTWWYICGACKKPIDKTDVFCRHCGRSVKWE